MRKFVCFMLMLFCAINVWAQTEPADYTVAVNKFKQYYNAGQPDSVYSMFAPEMKADMSREKWEATTTQIKTQLGNLNSISFFKYTSPVAQYNATFEKGYFTLNIGLNTHDQLIGLSFTEPQKEALSSITFSLDPSLTESTITLKTLSGTIYGTLTMPKNASGKIPVVLIIPGSGPVDRDGNELKMGLYSNTYKMLANELGKKGIASVRYDKRMIGQSAGSYKETDLRFEDYSDDASGIISMLADDERFSKVIVAGHSEGSLVGMIASRDEPVKGFISLSGAGEPAEKVLTEQMKSQPAYVSEGFKRVIDSLKRGKTYPQVEPQLYNIARPSIQMYLMSWCRYDPAVEIRKLKMPILIIQGTNDFQVSVENAQKLKSAKSSASLMLIRGMNHILKDAPADRVKNEATYKDPNLPLNTEMVTDVVDFIKKL